MHEVKLQLGKFGAIQQTQSHPAAEPARHNAQPRIARRPGNSATVGSPCIHAKAGGTRNGPAPTMTEPQTLELGEGLEKSLGEAFKALRALLMTGLDASAEMINGIVAAPENSIVGGQPVVVKLVGLIAEPLTILPAKGGELIAAEGFGHEHVVPDRNRCSLHTSDRSLERVGRQQTLACAYPPRFGANLHPRAMAGKPLHGCLLVDAHPQLANRPQKAPCQPGRIHDRPVRGIHAPQVGR